MSPDTRFVCPATARQAEDFSPHGEVGPTLLEPNVMRFKTLPKFLLCTLLFLTSSSLLFAQATTSLGGRVTDSSGAIIPNATVTLKMTTTGVTRVNATSSGGEYQFSQLAPGRYTLLVTAPGFGSVEKTNMELLVSQPATLNVVLTVASVQQQVTVTSMFSRC